MPYECKIEERPAQPALSIRTRTSVDRLPEVLGPAYGEIMAYLGELGAYPSGPPYSGYFNMDMQDLDVEIGMPVAQPLPGKGNIQTSEIPACKAATTLHTGPYADFGKAYDALQSFMDEQGVEGKEIAYEFYLNDPGEVASKELQTLIVIPLK